MNKTNINKMKKLPKQTKKITPKKVIKPRKKVKYNYKNILIFILVLAFLAILLNRLVNIRIKNITVTGNLMLLDQEIIDIAGIRNYPVSISNQSSKLESKLENNVLIKNATVHKNLFLTKVTIKIEENKPLFFYSLYNKTVLESGDMISDTFIVPTVINQMPDIIYDEFLKKMNDVPTEVLTRISEIRYYPNDIDDELFLLSMNDGNYVYLTLNKFESINDYVEIVKSFDNKKGIIHLDSGYYLEVLE